MFQTPQEALNYIKENKIQIVDLKFIDMPGIWQHLPCSTTKSTKPHSQTAYPSTVPAFGAGKPSTNQT